MRRYLLGYHTAERIKKYDETHNITYIEVINKMRKCVCYNDCQKRCEECISIFPCDNLIELSPGDTKICHLCSKVLDEDWYYCSQCNSYRNLDTCAFCRKNKCCKCYVTCCYKRTCGKCTIEKSTCDTCKREYCKKCAIFHNNYNCQACLKKTCCSKRFCSKKCELSFTKSCECCEYTFVCDFKRDTLCYGCKQGYGNKMHIYGKCTVCSKFTEIKNYYQRDKISQPPIKICTSCKKGQLSRCSQCTCCIILNQLYFYFNNQKVRAYTKLGNKEEYICCRPNCQKAIYKQKYSYVMDELTYKPDFGINYFKLKKIVDKT